MSQLLGIHWIVTTHGSWLHGDPRGSWHLGKLIGPDPFLEAAVRRRMTHDAVVLSDDECDLVSETVRAICSERKHRILALAVQPTHMHLVFAPMEEPIKMVVARLKRRSAIEVLGARRAVAGQDGRAMVGHSLWSAGRFVVLIDDPRHLENSIAYVQRHAGGMAVCGD